MDFQLTEQGYARLKKMQKDKHITRKQYKKVTVLIMLHGGFSVSEIEESLGLDDNTVLRYKKRYGELGLRGYLQEGYKSYKGKMGKGDLKKLSVHLDDYLYEDAKSVCAYVKETFGVEYTESGMREVLHRLGFVYKQTKKVPSKADDAAQKEFLEEVLPDLIEDAKSGESVVYFADGCHPTHNTKTGRGWIRKGRDFEVDCNSGRKRVNINAASNALKPEHIVSDITESVNAQSTKRLFRKLLKKHPKIRINVIVDNARYYKNKQLSEWLEKGGKRINLIFLPPYSPNLNVIERLWRFMRKRVVNSIYYDSYSKFKSAVEGFLDNTKSYKKELRSLLTLNFKTVGGTSIYSQTNLA